MGRMFGISDPKWLIIVAVLFSLVIGSIQPFYGIYIGKMLFVLQPPEPITQDELRKVREDSNLYCLIMILLSTGCFIFTFLQMSSFGIISENVTIKMRMDLYKSILQKHIGWFDEKENTPGVLSSTMATEAQTINGVIAGGLATSLQSLFAVFGGIAIGFYFNWKISLVCLGCVPFMIIGGAMNAKF